VVASGKCLLLLKTDHTYQQGHTNSLEKYRGEVQVTITVHIVSVTMIESMNWVTLREHHKITRLSFFHDIVYRASAVNIPSQCLGQPDTLATTIQFILSIQVHHIKIATSQS